ncbi:MAG: hypothetical protein AUG51_22905 [Acidobacteria bacterium 13_1_20CM_3_53_8]|nr:MAG: hypothetical protein AUG51_22905 [Acidobacteria bacterium 13_1_20CM_3_53_8]
MSQENDNDDPMEESFAQAMQPDALMLMLIEKLEQRVNSNDEATQKKMEFIIEQQAKFGTDLQQMHETHSEEIKQIREVVGRLATASLNRFTELENKTTTLESDFDAKMASLIDAQMKTEATVNETTERLNAFINTVERLLSEGRGGNSQS